MEDAEAALQQQLPVALRQLQPTALQAIHQGHSLSPQLPPELQGLDTTDPSAFQQRLQVDLGDPTAQHQLSPTTAFGQSSPSDLVQRVGSGPPQTPQHQQHGGHFGILTPGSGLSHGPHPSIARLQADSELFDTPDEGYDKDEHKIHRDGLRLVSDPPHLAEWRQRLFDVNDVLTLTEEQYQTYFPHVDNIYSHRSTQRYKKKPFVSHYWDCRLKGRPPGTRKSDDPNKKKRKRVARQRDQCDVKIKITEYFPNAMLPQTGLLSSGTANLDPDNVNNFFAPGQPGGPPLQHSPHFGVLTPTLGFPTAHPGSTSQRYYTIQRVNGNGGNGKGDGVAGPHKHTLAMSDAVKRNSVERFKAKEEKQRKRTQKTYHKKATGAALATVKRHSRELDLKVYGSCFCPFVQRVWIALEAKGLPYQYVEVDPYKKPESLLAINPRGLVPALRNGEWGCYESTVLMEYLEDLDGGTPLLPLGEPQLRAHCRLWSDHINRNIVPLFYKCLQAQELDKQVEHAEALKTEIAKLVDAADPQGPFFLGSSLSFVDVQFAPWMLRLSRVLKPYRGWPDPEEGSRWGLWVEAIEGNEHIQATTSTDDLYLDSYERYAENRPDTSELAKAINAGRGLP
ncbi:MAG: hypothetical protein M1817_001643 [Caeruleum heppii]|nr:MAG: hypothetical protein M1817_001643 [Caeruleum heppii]